jgi:O-antigen/teichoic acid export membrane protein
MQSNETAQLRRDAASGVRWNALGTGTATVLNFVQTAVLARLLGPEAFGLMAIVGSLLIFAKTIGDFGIASSVVRTAKLGRGELAALFWLQLLLTTCVFAVVAVVAQVWAYIEPLSELPALLTVASSVMLISVLGVVHRALAQRAMRFRFLVLVGILSNVVGTATAIISAAVFQQGVWSFIWGSVAGAVTGAACLLVLGGYAREVLAEWPVFGRLARHIPFGLHVTGSQLLNNAASRLDRLIIGAFLGTTALGYYSIALSLTTAPLRKINPIITNVAFPVFAKLNKNPSRIRDGYLRVQGLLIQLVAPLMLCLAAVAPFLIPLYLGEGWDPVIPLVQIFSLLGISRSLGNAGGSVVMALGRTKALFVFKLVSVVVTLATVYISSLFRDLLVVAWSLTLLHPILVAAQYRFVLTPLLGSFWKGYLKSVSPGVMASALMLLCLLALAPLLGHLPPLGGVFAGITVGATIYVIVVYLIDHERLSANVRLFLDRAS